MFEGSFFESNKKYIILKQSYVFRLKFFSPEATEYIKRIFWSVVNERKKKGKSSEKDLVNHLLKIKENMKLPSNGDPSK